VPRGEALEHDPLDLNEIDRMNTFSHGDLARFLSDDVDPA